MAPMVPAPKGSDGVVRSIGPACADRQTDKRKGGRTDGRTDKLRMQEKRREVSNQWSEVK